MKNKLVIYHFFLLIFFGSTLCAQEKIKVVVQKGHLAPIHQIEFSNDDKFLLSVDNQNQMIVWSTKLGRQFNSYLSQSAILVAKFLPQVHCIAFSTATQQLVFWDFVNDTIIRTIQFDGVINDFSFTNSNEMFVASNSLYHLKLTTQEQQKINSDVYSRIEVNLIDKSFIAINNATESAILFDSEGKFIKNLAHVAPGKKELKITISNTKIDHTKIFIDPINQSVHLPLYNSAYSIDLKTGQTTNQLFTDYFDINCTAVAYSSKNSLLIYGTSDDKIFCYNEKTKKSKILRQLHLASITDICFSKNEKYFASASSDQSIIIWNAENLEPVHRLSLSALPLYSINSNNAGSAIAIGNALGEIKLIYLGLNYEETTIQNFKAHTEIVSDVVFTDSIIWSSGFDNYITKTNIKTGKSQHAKATKNKLKFKSDIELKKSLLDQTYRLSHSVFLNHSSNTIGVVKSKLQDEHVTFYDTDNQGKIFETGALSYESLELLIASMYQSGLFNSDSSLNNGIQKLTTTNTASSKGWGFKETVQFIDSSHFIANFNLSISLFKINKGEVMKIQSYPQKKDAHVFNYNQKENLVIYSFQNELHFILNASIDTVIGQHDMPITAICFIPNSHLIATSSQDGTVKLWDYHELKKKCTLIPVHRDKLLLITEENYYYSINDAVSEIGFKIGENFYPVEQFDLIFNRPDIVLDKIGFADSNLISAYKSAYHKRLKKAGFTEDMLSSDLQIPTVRIENMNNFELSTTQNSISLKLVIEDSVHFIDRINVWINDVAVFGTQGISVREKMVKKYNTEIQIPLAFGQNKIQVSVLNSVGVESYKEEFDVNSSAGKSTPDLYIVSLGVSNYKDSRYNLTYASKDATDMSLVFEKNKFFANVFTKTLTDEKVVLENLIELKTFLASADINDQVIVFVAGHGVLDANFDYYFASYDMDFQNPAARGIPYELIESLLDGIKPLKKLLLMDTCHSGEVDKDDIQISDNKTESENDITFRNVGVAVENKENQLGLQNTSELMKSLFTDLRKGTGATVISSAGGVEFAMESDTWQNGLFTYCLINGLTTKAADLNSDKLITVSELQMYVQTEVSKLSNGKQTPTSRIQNNEMDYRVW